VVYPSVQFKPVESDSLLSNWDLCQVWPDFRVETVAIHAEIERRVTQPQQAGQEA
jgi:hypothetical protein